MRARVFRWRTPAAVIITWAHDLHVLALRRPHRRVRSRGPFRPPWAKGWDLSAHGLRPGNPSASHRLPLRRPRAQDAPRGERLVRRGDARCRDRRLSRCHARREEAHRHWADASWRRDAGAWRRAAGVRVDRVQWSDGAQAARSRAGRRLRRGAGRSAAWRPALCRVSDTARCLGNAAVKKPNAALAVGVVAYRRLTVRFRWSPRGPVRPRPSEERHRQEWIGVKRQRVRERRQSRAAEDRRSRHGEQNRRDRPGDPDGLRHDWRRADQRQSRCPQPRARGERRRARGRVHRRPRDDQCLASQKDKESSGQLHITPSQVMEAKQRAGHHERDAVSSPREPTKLSGRRKRTSHPEQRPDHETRRRDIQYRSVTHDPHPPVERPGTRTTRDRPSRSPSRNVVEEVTWGSPRPWQPPYREDETEFSDVGATFQSRSSAPVARRRRQRARKPWRHSSRP